MPSNTRPKEPRTGYAHPGCYARELLDCSTKLSFEHYYTKNLLERMGPYFVMRGAQFIPRGQERKLTQATLGANILCQRHNEALSPLDTAIGRFWDALMQIQHARPSAARLHDGHDLERWALKAFVGQMVAGTVREREGMQTRFTSVPIELIRILFGEREVADRCGFWFTGERLPEDRPDGFTTWLRANENRDGSIGATYAIDISMLGLPWITTFLTPLSDDVPSVYRPRGFCVRDRGVIELSWVGACTDYIGMSAVPFMQVANQ